MPDTGRREAIAPQVIVHVQTRMLTGGAEENTWASCEHQIRQGHQVHLVCGRDSRVDYYRSRNAQVRVHVVPEMGREISLAQDFRAYRRLVQLLKKIRPDIVHTHTSKAGIVGRFAAHAAKLPVILHGVHMLPFSNVGLVHRLVYLMAEHAAAPLTHRYIHVSEGTRRAYLNALIGRNKSHAVVRSGMEIARFQTKNLPDDCDDLIGNSLQSARPKVILMLAALEARKRHAEFIRAFVRELGDSHDTILLIAGDGPERENVEQLIEALGASRVVRMLGHREDAHKLIHLADVTALASLREGLPRVVVQSLAGGRPAIVSPIEGIEEIVTDGDNGIVVPDPSAASVAQAAVRLVRDPARLELLKRGAERSKVDDWTFASMFRQLDRSYREAIRSSEQERGARYEGNSVASRDHELASDTTAI